MRGIHMSDYYYPKGKDPLGWAAKAVENFAEFRETIRRSQEHPMYVDQRIDEGMNEYRRLTILAVKFNVSSDVVQYAETVVRVLRSTWKFFHYLSSEIPMNAADEATNNRLEKIASDNDAQSALSLILTRDEISLACMSALIKRYDRHAKAAGVPSLYLRLVISKLDGLQQRLMTG